ncbi:uncharacterized protein LOC125504716 [Dendroctonus ponderosae]|uniref:uncharacterized protein LOC125504704 n=1 Tax=Dendroctonus ponderosae TaxID=77166 RepID=UPI0020361EB2|nr:uncharacterized protein LOC125504704 [Dendroctonus ponderosae]XP_048523058.1 uncharacterized protein LOC125504716 [Dendroctonus ponderosae]
MWEFLVKLVYQLFGIDSTNQKIGSSAMGERMEPPTVPGPDLVGVNVERPSVTQQQQQQSSLWNRRQQAVSVRHAYKHYGSNKNPNHVLSDLNMTVAKGTMYVYLQFRQTMLLLYLQVKTVNLSAQRKI